MTTAMRCEGDIISKIIAKSNWLFIFIPALLPYSISIPAPQVLLLLVLVHCLTPVYLRYLLDRTLYLWGWVLGICTAGLAA